MRLLFTLLAVLVGAALLDTEAQAQITVPANAVLNIEHTFEPQFTNGVYAIWVSGGTNVIKVTRVTTKQVPLSALITPGAAPGVYRFEVRAEATHVDWPTTPLTSDPTTVVISYVPAIFLSAPKVTFTLSTAP
jgi:preprotein translocase subunit SecE